MQGNERPLYERFGGGELLKKLVNSFYDKVAQHSLLAEIFPQDLTETKYKQYLFLTQFFGGDPLYSQKFGHPMLRARHMPFTITPQAAEAWLACMKETLEELDLEEEVKSEMFTRFTFTAHHMINTPDDI